MIGNFWISLANSTMALWQTVCFR